MNLKIIFLLVVSLFTLTTIYADTEYQYELEIDYNFDEDEEIECKLDLGDRKKTETFDDNDDRDDMTFEGRFDDSIEVDCDERVDISLRVLDLDDNEVEDIREDNLREFIYELELFEGVITFTYDFPDNVDTLTCELLSDEQRTEYTYEKADDDSLREEIEYEFLEETEFECSERLEEVRLRVEDPVGFDIYDLFLEDEDKINFDENTPRHKYDIAIFFTKDFNEEEVDCDVDIDSNSDFTLEFTDSSSGSERNLNYVFGESFEISCDDEFEEALVDIVLLEDDDVKVFQRDYYNERSISITTNNIENWEPQREEDEVEEEEEKVIIPEVVNPRPTTPEEPEEVEEEQEDVSETTENQNITSSNTDTNNQETNLTSTPLNESEENLNDVEKSNPTSIIYGFIAIVALILVIAIVILVMKL